MLRLLFAFLLQSSAIVNGYVLSQLPVHTLLLVRQGGCNEETYTGWNNVPLSQEGREASQQAAQAVKSLKVDICFTSTLARAQETTQYCLNSLKNKIPVMADYRLNARHYGALQGTPKKETAETLGDWNTKPPQLDEMDPRRMVELRKFSKVCGGPQFVPKGESLSMVAENRILPWFRQVTPMLNKNQKSTSALVVAHANSLRAILGVLCGTSSSPETMPIPTGVPIIMRYQQLPGGKLKACTTSPEDEANNDLPAWPLEDCISLDSVMGQHGNLLQTDDSQQSLQQRR